MKKNNKLMTISQNKIYYHKVMIKMKSIIDNYWNKEELIKKLKKKNRNEKSRKKKYKRIEFIMREDHVTFLYQMYQITLMCFHKINYLVLN